jgi:Cd2+/Zn2+-exporting ATPase
MKLNLKQKRHLIRIIVAFILFLAVFIADKTGALNKIWSSFTLPLALYLIPYVIIAHDIIIKAVKGIIALNPLDENFLMAIASIGAFILGIIGSITTGEHHGFEEGSAVIIFYQVGNFFEKYAVSKTRNEITALTALRPEYANLITENGIEKVPPKTVKVGSLLKIYAGEKVPIDSVIISGETEINTQALTGESTPQHLKVGDKILSGSVNILAEITVKTEKDFKDSTVNKIIELTISASSKKSKAEVFLSKFARYYTPIVVSLAVILAVVPSLILGNPLTYIYRALNFLVVSCPCALVISVPMSFFIALSQIAKQKILIKGSSFIEKLSNAKTFCFDKTGTLTTGNFKITNVYPKEKQAEILETAYFCEKGSSHPLGLAIVKEYESKHGEKLSDFTTKNLAGLGVVAQSNDNTLLAGNGKLLSSFNIDYPKIDNQTTYVLIAKNGCFLGVIEFSDEIKEDAKSVINHLNNIGAKSVILSGDNDSSVKKTAESLGITCYKSQLLPDEKLTELEKIIDKNNAKNSVLYIGDGINDAPVIRRADVGIAMGKLGSDIAIESADIVLLKDDLTSLITAEKTAKTTMKIVKQNMIFVLTIKIAILVLSALGLTNMWVAVFGDVGVALLAILNAFRIK